MRNLNRIKPYLVSTGIYEAPIEWIKDTVQNVLLNIQTGFASGKRDENGIVQLRMNNIDSEGIFNFDELLKIPKPDDIEKFVIKKDDIIFNNTNSLDLIGKVAIAEENLPFTFSNHLTRLRVNKKIMFPIWLCLMFLRYKERSVFKSICNTHVGQSGIGKNELSRLEIFFPTIEEQEKIIRIISKVTELIQIITKIISLTEVTRNSLIEQLMSKGIGHQKFRNIQLSPRVLQHVIPTDWKIDTLENILRKQPKNGITLLSSLYGNGYPIIEIDSLYRSNFFLSDTCFRKVPLEPRELDNYRLSNNDFIINRVSKVKSGAGKLVLIKKPPKDLVYEGNLISFAIDEKILIPEFFEYYSKSKLYFNYMQAVCKTLSLTSIDQDIIHKIPVPIPSTHEQKQILNMISNFDLNVTTLQEMKICLRKLKNGLIQNCLTGRIRIKS